MPAFIGQRNLHKWYLEGKRVKVSYLGEYEATGVVESSRVCYGGTVKENFAYWCIKDDECDKDQKGMTLKTFCETYNKGKYAVYIKGHMTVVHDGKIVDSFAQRGNAAVITAYRKPD